MKNKYLAALLITFIFWGTANAEQAASNTTNVGVGVQTGSSGASSGSNSSSIALGGAANVGIDLSQGDTSNRQFMSIPHQGIAPQPVQPSDHLQQWNASPYLEKGIYRSGNRIKRLSAAHISETVAIDFPPTQRIAIRGFIHEPDNEKPSYRPPVGQKIGSLSLILKEEHSLEDALLYALHRGMQLGANQMILLSRGIRQKTDVQSKSIGFGTSSGFVAGSEVFGASAGGGTGLSATSATKEGQPFVNVDYYRSGEKK